MENTSSIPPVQSVIINEDSSPVSLNEPTRPDSDASSDNDIILNSSIHSSDQDEIGHMIIHEDPSSPVDSNELDSNEDISDSDVSSDESDVGYSDYDASEYMNLRHGIPRAFEDQDIDSQETVHSKEEK